MNTSYNRKELSIAIVGSGPRGLSVLERLAVYIQRNQYCNITIYLIDDYQVGCGRIWRTNQPNYYLMNTPADEVSSFSGPLDDDGVRPGSGPSLAQWWKINDPNYPGPSSYAPRRLHGQYMQFVLEIIESQLDPQVKIVKVNDRVADLKQDNNIIQLYFNDGKKLHVDQVVLATGHTTLNLRGKALELSNFASSYSHLEYFQGDSAADMHLEKIAAGKHVGILGLGLSFYDVLAAFTIGRGGQFTTMDNGDFKYIPSGKEPLIFAGSRSSLPIPSRGKNQKGGNYRYKPVFFTMSWAKALRRKGEIDFVIDVLPVLLIEVNLTYYATAIRLQKGGAEEQKFRKEIESLDLSQAVFISNYASRYGIKKMPPIDIEAMARPFSERQFSSPDKFQKELLGILNKDLLHAEQGNVNSPLKAALDTIRDTRSIVRELVNFGGLNPESHKDDFLDWYAPRSAFLTAGPPLSRTKQLIALIRSGILRIVGPQFFIEKDIEKECFRINSLQVDNSHIHVETVIDARVPTTDIAADKSPLTKSLIQQGVWANYINKGESTSFITGGVAVTQAPFHPIGKAGTEYKNIYVLGIPSEHTRWFMHAGSSRPGYWTDFVEDANSIAENILNVKYKKNNHDIFLKKQA